MEHGDAQLSGTTDNKAPLLERFVFSYRWLLLLIFAILTIVLGFQASKLDWEVNFTKMIPTQHTYIENYLKYQDELRGFGDSVRIAVETTSDTIFDADYLSVLQEINDEVFFFPGVNRAQLQSLWTPQTRWREVTEEGFDGGPVIPPSYDGSPESLAQLKTNVLKSGEIGSLVANDFKSSIIDVPLYEINPDTKKPLDYRDLSQRLEELRDKYEKEDIKIHITGFAKVVGELIDGTRQVATFFLIAILITLLMLYGYSRRCIRSTLIPVLCSIIAVVWQLGLLKTLGYGLDPFSILVPFLIFAIGVSHGVQIINGIHHEMMAGADKMSAARGSFRKLYKPGLVALITDCLGFGTLLVIQVLVIQELAIGASIGVFVLILTNLILLPILMSYAGVNPVSVKHIKEEGEGFEHRAWLFLSRFTRKTPASVTVFLALLVFALAAYFSQGLPIGQTGQGAPELRPESQYNQDVAFMNENYSKSSDIFVVMVKTPEGRCGDYHTLVAMDRLQWDLEHIPAVLSTNSLCTAVKRVLAGYNEGSLKWMALVRDDQVMSNAVLYTASNNRNQACSLSPIRVFMKDHEADSLQAVVDSVEEFSAKNNTEDVKFLMAAGNAGIEATTNIVVAQKQYTMMFWVFGVIALLCLITFRSARALFSIIIPLALTTVLCRMVMMWIGVGVNVATLPVIALGVGVGVDYGIYIFSRFQFYLDEGMPISGAYYATLMTTGKAVIFTGLTLAVGVCTWAFSPIKFQADMGILLTFMFLVNMIGAIILLPAIASLWERRARASNNH